MEFRYSNKNGISTTNTPCFWVVLSIGLPCMGNENRRFFQWFRKARSLAHGRFTSWHHWSPPVSHISCFPAARRKLIRPRRVELHYLVVALKGLMKLSSNHHASIRYAPGRRPQSAQQWNSSASVRLTAFPILLHGFGRARWEKFFSFQDGILFVLATCKSWL